ncbi:MAG: ABC-type Fe3+ transport system periplasmic component, partial [Chloroflexi bacterium]|nr:ABC-type Fe3+ transport system periplasmic component [Chloroflexota bacterium]
TVSLYAGAGGDLRGALVEAFEKAYPGIDVQETIAPGGELVSRVLTERTAGRYLADVILGQTISATESLKPAGALAPLRPALVHPEVIDESRWLENRLWWTDAREPLTNLRYQGTVQTSVFYNTELVDPREFSSYRDFLDPKWRGRIVSTDIRRPGPGSFVARFMWKDPTLGPQYLERLYGEMNITIANDQRQMVDWLAQGQFPIGLFLSTQDIIPAMRLGLPIEPLAADQMREGAVIGPGGGAVTLADRAPHPNAAKLYLNWLLSRDGQTAWQTVLGLNSLRTDLPKDALPAFTVPKPNVKYIDAGTEEYGSEITNQINDLLSRVLA